MIPWNMRLKVGSQGERVNIWIPLAIVWLLLLPLVLLLVVVWGFLLLVGTVSVHAERAARILSAAAVVIWHLGGLKLDIRSPDSGVIVRFW